MDRRWLKLAVKSSSWVPTEYRAQLSRDSHYLILILEGRLYSVPIDLLLELIAGHGDSLRLCRLEDHL